MSNSEELGKKILQFRLKGRITMIDEETEETITTSLTVPKRLMDLLRQDAKRCRRSMAGQLTAILDVIYCGRDVEIHGTEHYQPAIETPARAKQKVA